MSVTDEDTDPEENLSRCPAGLILSASRCKHESSPWLSLYSQNVKGHFKIAFKIHFTFGFLSFAIIK